METKEFSTKSRVRGDFQARFCEKGRVKFPPTYSTLSKDGKRTLFAEASKFCLDIAKLVIGGVLLASIMKEDIDKITLYMLGVLIVLFFTFLGFLFLIISKKIK